MSSVQFPREVHWPPQWPTSPASWEEAHSLSASDEGAWSKTMRSARQDTTWKPSVVLFIVATGAGNSLMPWWSWITKLPVMRWGHFHCLDLQQGEADGPHFIMGCNTSKRVAAAQLSSEELQNNHEARIQVAISSKQSLYRVCYEMS